MILPHVVSPADTASLYNALIEAASHIMIELRYATFRRVTTNSITNRIADALHPVPTTLTKLVH